MRTRKILLNIDLLFQVILFFGAVGSALLTAASGGLMFAFFVFAILLLGLWQMTSGVIMGIILKDNLRAKYFFASIFYWILIITLGQLVFGLGGAIGVMFTMIFVVIIPLRAAFWYLKLTNLTLNKLNVLDDSVTNMDEFEDVLDSEEIFKPIKNS